MKRPQVLVVTRRTARKTMWIDYVAEAHLKLLVHLDTLPVMVPVVEGISDCLPEYMETMRGLLLVEGEDIEPKQFEATPENHEYLEKTHPLKDEIELHLIRHALKNHLPYLGICRGSQLLNVACGGTLYGDVEKQKKSRLKHINHDHYHTYRHPITIRAGSPLQKWYGRKTLMVNSYHHQGVRDLAPRFRPMAHAKDGLVEAYYDPKIDFLVGLQFHPERLQEEPEGNLRIWEAFGAAIHRAHAKKEVGQPLLAVRSK
jgi:gamma-glutamyl-gamma-aminobutyrate hydrolase PuuD